MTQSVLILGGTGRFGRHATHAFQKRGWTVHQFNRARDNLAIAAKGMDVIVNGWNPLYPDWAKDVPEITRMVINAARSSGATVIIPGNVYVFGQNAPEIYAETTPHNATNGLGLVRIEMERAYKTAGVKTIIIRAGDFIDTRASGNWFDMFLTPKAEKGIFTYPGEPGARHAWAWLPDVTRAAVMLAEKRDEFPVFCDVPFPGYAVTGNQMCAEIAQVLDRDIRLKPMHWFPVQIAKPFWPMAKYILEMRYLWNKPHQLSNGRLTELLPDFTPTPLSQAFAIALGKTDSK